MNGNAPKSPLTGSHDCLKKKSRPNFEIVRRERAISSQAISATIAKIVKAHISISQRKARSLSAELPRSVRNLRMAEGAGVLLPVGEGEDPGDGGGTTGGPDTRASWTLGFTTQIP